MASYISTTVSDKQYQSLVPQEAIAFALSSRQQRYDHELNKLQTFTQNLANIDLYKDEDIEHFNKNLKHLFSEVKKYGTGDLSLTGAGRIMSHIAQAADDKVVNGYTSTKQLRKVQSDFEALKKKDPKLYNQANYDYAMVNVSKWLNDGKAGTSINDYYDEGTGIKGIGSATPYFDKLELAQKILKEKKPDITWTTNSKGVQVWMQKNEVISDEAVEEILKNVVYTDSRFRQQMEIDSWYKYRNVDDNLFKQAAYNTQQKGIISIDKAISDYDKIKNKVNNQEAQQIEEYINTLKERKAEAIGSLANWDDYYNKNKKYIKQQFHEKEFSEGLKSLYAQNNIVDIKVVTDQAALEGLKHSYAKKQLEYKSSLDQVNSLNTALVGADYDKAMRIANMIDKNSRGKTNYKQYVEQFKIDNAVSKSTEIELNNKVSNAELSEFKQRGTNLENAFSEKINVLSKLVPIPDGLTSLNSKGLSLLEETVLGSDAYKNANETIKNNIETVLSEIGIVVGEINDYKEQEGSIKNILKEVIEENGIIETKRGNKYFMVGGQIMKQDVATVGEVVGLAWGKIKGFVNNLTKETPESVELSLRLSDREYQRYINPTTLNVIEDKPYNLLTQEEKILVERDIERYKENLATQQTQTLQTIRQNKGKPFEYEVDINRVVDEILDSDIVSSDVKEMLTEKLRETRYQPSIAHGREFDMSIPSNISTYGDLFTQYTGIRKKDLEDGKVINPKIIIGENQTTFIVEKPKEIGTHGVLVRSEKEKERKALTISETISNNALPPELQAIGKDAALKNKKEEANKYIEQKIELNKEALDNNQYDRGVKLASHEVVRLDGNTPKATGRKFEIFINKTPADTYTMFAAFSDNGQYGADVFNELVKMGYIDLREIDLSTPEHLIRISNLVAQLALGQMQDNENKINMIPRFEHTYNKYMSTITK